MNYVLVTVFFGLVAGLFTENSDYDPGDWQWWVVMFPLIVVVNITVFCFL
jgi:hypothetical protein